MGRSRAPALIGSVLLHALVIGAGFIVLPFAAKPFKMADAVPITIVSTAPPAPATAPTEAPLPTPETTPAPEPAPQPAPAPAPPPAPIPKPTPAPAPPEPKPAPTPKPAPAPTPKPAKPLDLNALAESLPQAKPAPAKSAKAGAKSVDLAALAASLPKGGAKGPAQHAVAPVVSTAPLRPMSGDAFGAVTAKLIRLWNPNCGAEGADKPAPCS